MKRKSVVRGISMPAAVHDRLLEQARREDRPVSWIVRRAVQQYLNEQAGGDKWGGELGWAMDESGAGPRR